MEPEILERRRVYHGYMSVDRLKVRLADGAEVWREVERHGDSVAVLPYDEARGVALVVRLFRAPVFDAAGETWLEEACAGMIDEETAEAAATREGREELGMRLDGLEPVGRVWSSPGVSAERQHLFLASYAAANRVGPGGGLASENEAITVVERSLASLAAEADEGRIADAKLLTLVQTLRLRRPDLCAEPSERRRSTP